MIEFNLEGSKIVFSPQSQAIIERLLKCECIGTGSAKVGPLDEQAQILLSVTVEHFETLNALSGDERAKFLRSTYRAAKVARALASKSINNNDVLTASEKGTATVAPKSIMPTMGSPPKPKSYRLLRVTCVSFRGIAPEGESVTFEFDGVSNLIYGGNGSGKTSLLGAVIWTLTGVGVTDAHDSSESAPVFSASSSDHRGTKIVDWPVVGTLPSTAISKLLTSNCSATVELRSGDGGDSLYLRRSISSGFDFSKDGKAWNACRDLASLGIDTLDLQLSLRAPVTFARLSVESAPDTKTLLGLMLGFDDLEKLGDLASTISSNRTRLATKESKDIEAAWSDLRQRLTTLPGTVPAESAARTSLEKLAATHQPTKKQIEETGQAVVASIAQAEVSLANLIGAHVDEANRSQGLADKVTAALVALERDFWEIFPRLGQIRAEVVFPSSEERSSAKSLAISEAALNAFCADAKLRIQERLVWWRSECKPGSKATL